MGGKDGCYDNYMKWVHMAWIGCIIGNPSGCGHEDLLGDDTDDVVSSLSVIPNEIVSYIIHLVLLSDLTMLGTINRVSETFRECGTVDISGRLRGGPGGPGPPPLGKVKKSKRAPLTENDVFRSRKRKILRHYPPPHRIA